MSLTKLLSAGLIAVLVTVPRQSLQAEEPLVDRVKTSITKGITYLNKKQENRGNSWNWDNNEFAIAFEGGPTCLVTLALLTAGVKQNDPVIQRALPSIRAYPPKKTYVVALQTMVLAEIGQPKDLTQIQRNVKWLLERRMYNKGKLDGWSYGDSGHVRADNSNTQYALLGLLYGRMAGVSIDKKDWQEIQDFYMRTQDNVGGWSYTPNEGGARHTMTIAGLAGLYIAGLELNTGQQELDEKTGVAKKCGQYQENAAIAKGMDWWKVNMRYEVANDERDFFPLFYNIYGIERAGRLSGQRFIGDHDWYREGCERLTGVKRSRLNQQEDGSWKGGALENNTIATAFALLFLAKGRTPILISKMAYASRPVTATGWNNKHHDCRNLVEYASRDLFKKQPMGWQIYDPRKPNLKTEKEINEELSTLLASPILYMNGHSAPELSDQQIVLLRKYLEEGGFLFAEACCGNPAFTNGFIELMKKVFKEDSPLTEMKPDHPIWTAHTPIELDEMYRDWNGKKIMCIERGCKTVAVLTPVPLAGFWEEIRHMPSKPAYRTRGEMAYRFAGNIIAYATGLEPPKPKGTKIDVANQAEEKFVPRHMVQLAQLKHDGDSEPAPAAMRNLAVHLRDHFRLDVSLKKQVVRMSDADLMQHKIMYMHGRRAFTTEDDHIKHVRANINTGGTLFADACCGAKEFDAGFRAFATKLYPDKKFERIPLDDALFSEKLNGRAITTVRCRTEKPDGSAEAEYQEVQPLLEGIKVGNRWAIIYSKYDLGCALEKHKSSACKGYDYDSALRLASACVLYAMKN